MKKLLYISTGIPIDEVTNIRKNQVSFKSNALLTISTYHNNIIEGLKDSYDEITALCGVPIDNKSFNIKKYISKKYSYDKVVHIIPGFYNYPIIKQLTQTIKIAIRGIKWANNNRNDELSIIVDGSFYCGLIALNIILCFYKIKCLAIIVDKYDFMNPERKKLSQKMYYRLLKKVSTFAFVTEHLEALINEDKKDFMILEGLVAKSNNSDDNYIVEDYCLYAGGLHSIYGVKTLVNAFHLSNVDYNLHLYGNGDAIDYIKEMSLIDKRIQYKGVASHNEMLEIEKKAKLLINPRPVCGKLDTRYNFPSKLMEYMQSGRPVITTRLLGIPNDYDKYMYYFQDDSEYSIQKGIENVLSIEENELKAFGNKARCYVQNNKNNYLIGEKLFNLVNYGGNSE